MPTTDPKVKAIHKFLRDNYPKTGTCKICGEQGKTVWANIRMHVYTHNIEDYLEMCNQCHYAHDRDCKDECDCV